MDGTAEAENEKRREELPARTKEPSKNNGDDDWSHSCGCLAGEIGLGCLSAFTVLIATIGAGLYLGVAWLMGWA